jgi:hypothetical protein
MEFGGPDSAAGLFIKTFLSASANRGIRMLATIFNPWLNWISSDIAGLLTFS